MRSNTIRRARVGLLSHDSSNVIAALKTDVPITGNITGSCYDPVTIVLHVRLAIKDDATGLCSKSTTVSAQPAVMVI